jgi:pyruvate kinase
MIRRRHLKLVNAPAYTEPSDPRNWRPPQVMVTVGPTLETRDDLVRAIDAGAEWFRLPCGYRERPHVKNALCVREAAELAGKSVQLLLDLPSSRPRTGKMPELQLKPGDQVVFWDPADAPTHGSRDEVASVPLPGLADLTGNLVPQQRMWFCDGRLNFVVDEVRAGEVHAHMVSGTVPLKSSNSLYLPDSPSPFTAVTATDCDLLKALKQAGVLPDWIALSLIASPGDVREAREAIPKILGQPVKLMAKFETISALECAEEIIEEAEGLMVARGDLGLAVGYVRLPEAQERLVALGRRAGKVTVVATQILETFSETGLPQRAELSDLSVIARQRADTIMFGKETVFSPRPLECIRFAREVLAYETQRFEKAARARTPQEARPRSLTR